MKLTNLEAINQAMSQLLADDKSILVIGEDVGKNGGVFRATDGLWKKFPKRVIDTPLAESGIVGTAIGLALTGFKPIAEIQFSGFMYLAHNQLVSHAARYRLRSQGTYNLPMVVRAPHHGGFRALEHHGESHESIYAQATGLKVVIPSTPYDSKGLLIAAARDPDPVLFLEPIVLYRAFRQEVPEKMYEVPIGKADIRKEGKDLTIITWGSMTKPVMDAVAETKVDCEVIDMRSIVPFDEAAVLASVEKTGRCIIVHEAPKVCGFGSELAARIQEKVLLNLNAPVLRVTGFDVPYPFFMLEKDFIPGKERVLEAIDRVMSW